VKVADTIKRAFVSPCGIYRPWLSRTAPDIRHASLIRTALFCLNNPSTADDKVDDPTVKRGWAFTEAWGCNHMVFVNTNSYRSTDPRGRRPMAPQWERENHDVLRYYAGAADTIVCAWGDAADPDEAKRARYALAGWEKPLHHLGTLTKAGNPRHILYLKGDLRPTVWA
jgi:hypothetical protein